MARKDENEDRPEDFNDSDETFGLPEIEYEPINRDQPSSDSPQEDYSTADSGSSYENDSDSYDTPPPLEEEYDELSYTYEEEKTSPVWPKVLIGVLIVGLLGGAIAYYFLKYKPETDREAAEMAARELAEKEARDRAKFVEDSVANVEALARQHIADSIAAANAVPEVGTIETLNGRTGKFYAVISSNVDDDLLLDYANKLTKTGVSSTIIPPHGKVKLFRLAVASGDTWQEAQSKADELKGEYGSNVWVTKY